MKFHILHRGCPPPCLSLLLPHSDILPPMLRPQWLTGDLILSCLVSRRCLVVPLDMPDTDMTFERYPSSSSILRKILTTLVQSMTATVWASMTVAGLAFAQYLCYSIQPLMSTTYFPGAAILLHLSSLSLTYPLLTGN